MSGPDAVPAAEQRRWLLPVGLAVVALVVVANAGSRVGLGTAGDALVVTLGVAAYCAAALVLLLWFDAPQRVTVGLLLAMAGASVATHHGDPTGTGGVGLYLGVVLAPLRLPARAAALVTAAGVAAFDVQLLLEAENPVVFALVVTGGSGLFFLLGLLLRSEQDQRARAARLVEELERSREAEKAAAALAERARLSREVHDVLAHTLSGLVLQLEALALRARRDAPPLADAAARASDLARDGLREAREALAALRGDHVPGPDALPALVDEHGRATGTPARLRVEGPPAPLAADASLAVYRTVQEGLANARKHAVGGDVDVAVQWRADEVVVRVETAGGRPHEGLHRSGGGSGLTGLRERAELLGGALAAQPTRDGYRVELRVPVQRRPS